MKAALALNTIAAFESFGDRPALIDGTTSLSYRELLATTYRFARALDSAGLSRGDGIACLVGNRWELLPLKFATQIMGLRFVAMDPSHVVGGLDFLLDDVDAKVLVLDPRLVGPQERNAVSSHGATAYALGVLDGFPDLLSLARQQSGDPVPVQARGSDIAQLVYTGGTTGVSKAVTLTFDALEFATASFAERPPLPDGTRLICVTPVAHAMGTVAPALMRLGVPLELHDTFDVESFVEAVGRAGSAAVHLYPSYLYRLLDQVSDCPGLAHITTGGAPLLPSRYAEAIDRFGPIVAQAYGQFESFAITYLDHADAASRPELRASVGTPVGGLDLRIVDNDGNDLPAGRAGHVEVCSPGVMSGYWRRPDLSAEVLTDGRLRTGDLGYLDDEGYLYLVGRSADVITVNADDCYVGPIEAALASHPDVALAAVVGVPDSVTGQAIHAVVVPAAGRVPDPEELRRTVSTLVTPENVPKHVTITDALPLTPLGKPDKKALPLPTRDH